MFKSFEEIDVWKEARKLVAQVYEATSKGELSRDFSLKDQIRRAAVSCMSNVAEGFDSDTDQQFIQMLSYTRRSASEVQSILYAALDQKFISKDNYESLYKHAESVRKLSNGLTRYLRSKTKP